MDTETTTKKGKTAFGFEYEIPEDALDDMELLEMLVKLDKGDVSVLSEVLERVLGEKQKEALYEYCRVEGRVKATKIMANLQDMFGQLNDDSKK